MNICTDREGRAVLLFLTAGALAPLLMIVGQPFWALVSGAIAIITLVRNIKKPVP